MNPGAVSRQGLIAGLLAVMSCSCSILHDDNAATIASLGKRPVKLQDTAIKSSEARAMSAYRSFLDIGDESDARPQAMRRLADLNLEAEEYPQLEQEAVNADTLYPEQVADSIQLYSDVLALYPDRPDNDRVLYQLARAWERSAQPDQSLSTLVRLIEEYPQSHHRIEAQFRRGEILFVQKEYRTAGMAYRAVVVAGDGSPFYQQSLYKLGWCYFKQSLFNEGLDAFITLLDIQLKDSETGASHFAHIGRAERELLDDTLRVVSLGFSYQDGPDTVAGYFSQHGGRHYEDVIYDRLGLLYLQKGRYTDAAQTFQLFVDHNPIHIQAPQFQMRVIETYQQGKFPTLVLEAKKEFVGRYNLKTAYWQHHKPEDAGQVLGFLKSTLTDLARHYHALAQGNKKPEDYRQAIHWYRTYIASFPGDEATPKIHFLLAELLFESQQYQLATREYEHTAYDYGDHARAADAGYAAVLAYERMEQQLDGSEKQSWHQLAVENSLRFSTGFPQHPQATAVLTRASENLLAMNDFERSVQVSQRVIDNPLATPVQQRSAWTVQAHAWFDLKDYLQAEKALQVVLTRMPSNADDRTAMVEKLAAAIYKQGEAAQAAGDPAAAVGHFLRVRTATPSASIVATAEYDAAAGLMGLQQWSNAARVLDRFREAFPDDPRQAEVTRRLATAYLAEKQPLQAAIELERIGHSQGDNTLRREALLQAAELYSKAQQPVQSIAAYKDYISQFPQPVEVAVEARHQIAKHYLATGNMSQYHHWLQEIIAADQQAGAGRSDRTRYLGAKARFTLAEAAYESYRVLRLNLPLKKSLALKKRRMELALRQYEQAAGYQVAAVTTAATFRTAQIYTNLGEALLDSQRPDKLSGEALDQYNILLEEQAYPFEEQAIALHETNVQRMTAGMYDAWIEGSLQQLALLVPARYAKLERSVSYVEAIH